MLSLYSRLALRSRFQILVLFCFLSGLSINSFLAVETSSQETSPQPEAKKESTPTTNPPAAVPASENPPIENPPPTNDSDSSKKETLGTPKGKLPWAKANSGASAPKAKPQVTAKQLLVNVDDSQLEAIFDNQPFDISEEEVTLRILYRMPMFGLGTIHRLTNATPDWTIVCREPSAHRLQFYSVRGRVTAVEEIKLIAEQVRRFEMESYFRVKMKLENSSHTALLLVRHIPARWIGKTDLNEPASLNGLFLKTEAEKTVTEKGDATPLVFAGLRVAWHPDKVNPDLGVHDSLVSLGDLGMNVDLYEELKGCDGKPLGAPDRECFYGLLAAVGKTSNEDLETLPHQTLRLGEVLQEPSKQHGKLMTIEGRVRRVNRIAITEPDVIKRFGFDHYFEVYVYVPLNDTEVRIGNDKNDKNTPVLNNGFPITCCVRSLPDRWLHLTEGGDDLRENVRVTGFHFRMWGYETQMLQRYMAEKIDRVTREGGDANATANKRPLQPSPMFICPDVTFLPPNLGNQKSANTASTIAVVFVMLVIGITTAAIWFARRGDRKLESAVRRNIVGEDDSENHKPDFSGLG